MLRVLPILILLFAACTCTAQDYDLTPYVSMVPKGCLVEVVPTTPAPVASSVPKISYNVPEIASKKVSQAPRASRGMIYSSRWTFPGQPSAQALENHLSGPPHNISLSRLQSMTDQQLASLHDSLHGSSGQSQSRRRGLFSRWRR
jgi:hypothetical protein